MAVDVQLEDHIRTIEGFVGGCLRSPQDKTTRQTLLAELDNLDDQTARADAYSNLRSASVRYQVPRSWPIGATSHTSTGEDVPSAEFKAQVALVKAARNAIRDPTAEAQSALQRANDELAEVRRQARRRLGWADRRTGPRRLSLLGARRRWVMSHTTLSLAVSRVCDHHLDLRRPAASG